MQIVTKSVTGCHGHLPVLSDGLEDRAVCSYRTRKRILVGFILNYLKLASLIHEVSWSSHSGSNCQTKSLAKQFPHHQLTSSDLLAFILEQILYGVPFGVGLELEFEVHFCEHTIIQTERPEGGEPDHGLISRKVQRTRFRVDRHVALECRAAFRRTE